MTQKEKIELAIECLKIASSYSNSIKELIENTKKIFDLIKGENI